MVQVPNSAPLQVLSFVRQNEKDRVFAVLNFSAQPQTVTFHGGPYPGEYIDFFSDERVTFDVSTQMTLAPLAYKVLVN